VADPSPPVVMLAVTTALTPWVSPRSLLLSSGSRSLRWSTAVGPCWVSPVPWASSCWASATGTTLPCGWVAAEWSDDDKALGGGEEGGCHQHPRGVAWVGLQL